MRWLPAALLLAACQIAPEGDDAPPASAPPLATVQAAAVPEAEIVLDSLARNPWGGAISVDSFRALVASVDTSTASGVGLLSGAGTFHGGEVEAQNGERWQGLYPSPRGLELRAFEIRVETAYDPIVDEEGGPYTGQRVVTPFSEPIDENGNDFGDPTLALVRRADAPFSDGPVPTAFAGRWPVDTESLSLSFGDDAYTLSVVLGPEVVPGVRGERVLMLSDGWTDQPLAHLIDRDAGHPALLWAGDLDGDGRLDLLLDESWHYNLSLTTLYLSGEAAAGALVRRVARHETTGC